MPRAASLLVALLLVAISAAPADAAGLTVRFKTFPASVARNANATVVVNVKAGATCSISVTYKSGRSTAAGLVSKKASSSGVASWTWKVGSRTSIGAWPVRISCKLGTATGTVTRNLVVR